MNGPPVRALVVRCPDWPMVAAGIAPDEPAAVLRANQVVACTPAARLEGVARHQRRRVAQAHCPELVLVDHDPARDARCFEPVVAALDALTPRLEVTRPGQVTFPTRGPSRYFGGDEALAAWAHALATAVLEGRGEVRVGIADGPFAAGLAAGATLSSSPVRVVPVGGSAGFLAPFPLAVLDRPELVDVLDRLGLLRLGDLAALARSDVLARFGAEGLEAWHRSAGLDGRRPVTRPPGPELTVTAELDPPVEAVEPAAFVARGLADEVHRRLAARGSACTRVLVGAETDHGERLERIWGSDGAFTVAALTDRVRWQLDGWINGSGRHRPSAGLVRLWLAPEEVVASGGRQMGYWGSDAAAGARAGRAVARIQGLLGPGTVEVAEWRG
ncbi:MAG: DNA polymerase Y family protein, partial [Acidimicrobiia bacterium]